MNTEEMRAGLPATANYRYADVHGFGIGDIRRLVVYVVGEQQALLDAWGAVTAWFDGDVPPATLLGVHLLGRRNQLVEVDATIVRREAA